MHILCIGCGNMASAMIGKWLQNNITVTTISPSATTPFGDRVTSVTHLNQILNPNFDMVFYMAKPQMIPDILPNYTALNHIVWCTIAAGVPISTYKSLLGADTKIIRLMPNTPSAEGEGVCPAYTNDDLADTKKIESLLSPLGAWGWLQCEDDLHTVTALSSSGVAYIFYLMDCMGRIAHDMGLPEDDATTWAIQTVLGAGKIAQQSTDDLTTLHKKVTSPNGVTANALNVLMKNDRLYTLLQDTMAAAKNRSIELSK